MNWEDSTRLNHAFQVFNDAELDRYDQIKHQKEIRVNRLGLYVAHLLAFPFSEFANAPGEYRYALVFNKGREVELDEVQTILQENNFQQSGDLNKPNLEVRAWKLGTKSRDLPPSINNLESVRGLLEDVNALHLGISNFKPIR